MSSNHRIMVVQGTVWVGKASQGEARYVMG